MNENDIKIKLKKIFKFNKHTRIKFIEQYENYEYANNNYKQDHAYKLGDEVILKAHYLMRGEHNVASVDSKELEFVAEYGFISPDITKEYNKNQKTPLTVPVWNIQKDIKLKDYIINYSGATIKYHFIDEGKNGYSTKIVPYNKLNEELNNNRDGYFFKWSMEQTKEIRFLPSLARDVINIAFIMDLNNDYGKKILDNDIYNLKIDNKILKSFIPQYMIDDYIYGKRDDFTTNRESAILYGIPKVFIVGILVSRQFEQDEKNLNKLKELFPNCYIANLDGIVIRI